MANSCQDDVPVERIVKEVKMNALADVDHRLATDPAFREAFGRGSDEGLSELTEEERRAVKALRPLLAKEPKELAEFLCARMVDWPQWSDIKLS